MQLLHAGTPLYPLDPAAPLDALSLPLHSTAPCSTRSVLPCFDLRWQCPASRQVPRVIPPPLLLLLLLQWFPLFCRCRSVQSSIQASICHCLSAVPLGKMGLILQSISRRAAFVLCRGPVGAICFTAPLALAPIWRLSLSVSFICWWPSIALWFVCHFSLFNSRPLDIVPSRPPLFRVSAYYFFSCIFKFFCTSVHLPTNGLDTDLYDFVGQMSSLANQTLSKKTTNQKKNNKNTGAVGKHCQTCPNLFNHTSGWQNRIVVHLQEVCVWLGLHSALCKTEK